MVSQCHLLSIIISFSLIFSRDSDGGGGAGGGWCWTYILMLAEMKNSARAELMMLLQAVLTFGDSMSFREQDLL